MPDSSMSGCFDLLGDRSRENVIASGSTAAILNPLGSIAGDQVMNEGPTIGAVSRDPRRYLRVERGIGF